MPGTANKLKVKNELNVKVQSEDGKMATSALIWKLISHKLWSQ
jgi:hypothetical protein